MEKKTFARLVAVKVSEEVDEIEELFKPITPTLWRMREKAEELRRLANLPGYIDQPAITMTPKVNNSKLGYAHVQHHQ